MYALVKRKMRKNFHYIRVAQKIYEALEPLRVQAEKEGFKLLKMNAFCEEILWQYAKQRSAEVVPFPLEKERSLLEERKPRHKKD